MKLVANPARLSTTDSTFETQFKARLHWSAETDDDIERRVADILADVRLRGDAAVLDYTARFDGLKAASVRRALHGGALRFDSLESATRNAWLAASAAVAAGL